MTATRIISAGEATTLLANATPGPWRAAKTREPYAIHFDAPKGDRRIGLQEWESLAITYGSEDMPRAGMAVARANASLICAAHDLAETVIWLHQFIDRAVLQERERIAGWLELRARSPTIDAGDLYDITATFPSSVLMDAAFALRRQPLSDRDPK